MWRKNIDKTFEKFLLVLTFIIYQTTLTDLMNINSSSSPSEQLFK